VTPLCAGAAVAPSAATIPAGQSACQFTVTGPAAGSYSVDFTISPTLPRAGRPGALTVVDRATGPVVSITSATTQTAAFTFGQAFCAGDIPSGQHISANDADIDAVILNRWPDGSAKFALVSGVKAFAANTPLVLRPAPTTSAPGGTLVGTVDLVNSGATASITFGGNTVSWGASDWTSPFRVLSGGRAMSSWHYRKPIGSDPHLVAWLEVRCYRGGTVEVLPWIENGYLSVSSPAVKSGRVSFSLGGTVRYDSIEDANTPGGYSLAATVDAGGVLSLQHHSRHVLVRGGRFSHWLGQPSPIVVTHDRAYLTDTKLVPAYHPASIQESALAALTTMYNPGRLCYTTGGMGSTGYASDIGLLPNEAALYLVSGDTRAYAAVVSQGLSLGNYSIHYRDESTNRPLLFAGHPSKSMATQSGLPTPDSVNANVYASSHHPSGAYLPYLLTGWQWFVEEIQFQVTDHYLARNQSYREDANYFFYWSAWGWAHNEQGGTRAQAWQWRTCAMAAALTPDSDTAIRGQFVAALGYNAKRSRENVQSNNAANQFGLVEPHDPSEGWKIWQHAFLTASIGLVWDLDVVSDGAARADLQWFRDHLYKAYAGMLGRSGVATEYSFTRAANYSGIKTGVWASNNTSYTWFTTWGEVWTATWGSPNTDATANDLTGGNIGSGSSGLSTSYWGNIQPAIAYAVDHGAAGALAGYQRMVQANGWITRVGQFAAIPVWGIRPRTLR
jgi:hypothetical protein